MIRFRWLVNMQIDFPFWPFSDWQAAYANICDIIISDWLLFLIHIHAKLKNLQQTKLIVEVWRRLWWSFEEELHRTWKLHEETLTTGKEVCSLLQQR